MSCVIAYLSRKENDNAFSSTNFSVTSQASGYRFSAFLHIVVYWRKIRCDVWAKGLEEIPYYLKTNMSIVYLLEL